jgi:aminomethyltransferase
MATPLQRTGLYAAHRQLGGRMVPFAGWELPVHYDATGPLAEHLAVRTAAGLFDITHMGRLVVAGPEAAAFLTTVQTVDVHRLPPGHAHYTHLPYADGGLVDDAFLYHLPDAWWLVVNAANRQKDLTWLQLHAARFDVAITDLSPTTCLLALQGPHAQTILQPLTDLDLASLPYHRCAWATVAGVRTLIGATGYTGEYGYELCFPAADAVLLWHALLTAGGPHGLVPCGLAARDSLRLEAGLPLYGQELAADIDPFTAGLGRFVHFSAGEFIGREALLKIKLEGPARTLVGFELIDPAVPRSGYPVLLTGRQVGAVTSGMKSPTTGRFIGLAFVPAAVATPGTELVILVRDKPKRAVVVKRPFYTPAYRRKI